MRRNEIGCIGDFFEAGRAYTTQTGYLAPEEEWNFACTAVGNTPDGELIAFGFAQDGRPKWTPTGFGRQDFLDRAWNPAQPPEWLAGSAAPSAPETSPPAQAEEAEQRHGLTGRTALITLAMTELIPGAEPDRMTVQVAERYLNAPHIKNTWSGTPRGLAERIATAVWGDADGPLSPLAQAEDAKRRRDLEGEIGALTAGHDALTSAPWYPAKPGDLVHVHHEAIGTTPAFGETYLVAPGMADGFASMQLLAHTLPPDTEFLDGLVGCFAVDDDPDPLTELWMEAGPHLLTIVRDGRPVHVGGAR
ncbi:hypothetical protein O3S80_39300 [Streptomyces sp. Lzd4kr]|nr:hypothetical protein [Streptomyces sp. Lzd4kr]